MEKDNLKMALDKDEPNRLENLAPLSYFFFIPKSAKNANEKDINGVISYLKSKYSADVRDQITFIQSYFIQCKPRRRVFC